MKKTVLYFDLANTAGGSQVALHSLLKNIDKNRYQPVVVYNSCNREPCTLQTDCIPGVIYDPMEYKSQWSHTRIFSWFYQHVNQTLAVAARISWWAAVAPLAAFFRFSHLLLKHRPDIVHSNNGYSDLVLPVVCRMLGVPFIAHLRDRCTYSSADIFKITHRLSAYEIAVSNTVRDSCSLGRSGDTTPLVTIVDGIEDNSEPYRNADSLRREFALAPQQRTFGFIGRMVPWKGPEHFLQAAMVVLEQCPDAVAFVVGGGGDEDYVSRLRQLAQSGNAADRVRFTGYRQDVLGFISLLDVVVHCSITPEPLGLTIMESMSFSKPVVAYNLGGPTEQIVDGETGTLVEANNPAALAKGILDLLECEQLRKLYGTNGRRRFLDCFSGSRATRRIEQVYEGILGQ